MELIRNLITIFFVLVGSYLYSHSYLKSVIITLGIIYVILVISIIHYYRLINNINNVEDLRDFNNLNVLKTVCEYQDSEDGCYSKVEDKKSSLVLDMSGLLIISLLLIFGTGFTLVYF